jgi:hypothetical protein
VRNENVIGNYIRSITYLVGNVLFKHVSEFSAILLGRAHLSAAHRNAGLKLKRICSKRRKSRATTMYSSDK